VPGEDEVHQMAEVHEGLVRLIFVLRGYLDVHEVDWDVFNSNAGPGDALIECFDCLKPRFIAEMDAPAFPLQLGL